MSNELEGQLLFKARQGDAKAFEALHLYLNERIQRFVLRLIGDQFQVDDVVQDVFIALYRNLERNERSFRAL